MVVITKLIMLGIAIVCSVTLAFIVLEFVTDKVKNTSSKKRNALRFYVARDKNGTIWLYIGKPVRGEFNFLPCSNCKTLATSKNFPIYGLHANDYTNLKWEDEPVEVFVNMED